MPLLRPDITKQDETQTETHSLIIPHTLSHAAVTGSWLEELEVMLLTLTVLVTTIDAQWEGIGDVGSARYELALLPPCPTIRVLSYSK